MDLNVMEVFFAEPSGNSRSPKDALATEERKMFPRSFKAAPLHRGISE